VIYAYETGVLLVALVLWLGREIWRAHLWREVLERLDEITYNLARPDATGTGESEQGGQ
jgi:hypothetical protein